MEYTEEQRDEMLAYQRINTTPGTITYDRGGFEPATRGGFIIATTLGYVVYGDTSSLLNEQDRWFIPFSRVIEIEYDA